MCGTLLDRGSHTSRAGICNTLAHFYQQTTPNGASAQPSHTTVTAPRVDVPPWPPHCEIASSSTPNDRKKPSVSAAPFAITSTSALSINPPHDRVMSALRSAGGHGGSQGHEQLRQTVTTTPTSCTPLAPSTVSVTPCATCAAEPVTQQHTMATAGDMSWRGQARRSTRAPRSQAAQPSARVPTDEVDSRRRLSAVAAHVGLFLQNSDVCAIARRRDGGTQARCPHRRVIRTRKHTRTHGHARLHHSPRGRASSAAERNFAQRL